MFPTLALALLNDIQSFLGSSVFVGSCSVVQDVITLVLIFEKGNFQVWFQSFYFPDALSRLEPDAWYV